MSFLASLMCPREMEGGLPPFHKTEIVFRAALGHTKSAARLLTATAEPPLCLEHWPPLSLSLAARNWVCRS